VPPPEAGTPQISVIVPAYNAARTILQTLESVCHQSCSPSEIIIVDDGSTDITADIVKAAARLDPRIRLLRQQRQGPSVARNKAIAESKGQYIAPLDADDLWHPDYLAAQSAALARLGPSAGFVYCWHHLIDESGNIIRPAIPIVIEGRTFGPLLLTNFVGNGSSAMFCREAVIEAGGYRAPAADWPHGEDYLLQLRIASRRLVACVQQDLVSYRKMPDGLSANIEGEYRARIAAVECALREGGPVSVPVLKWARGDAARVRAIRLLDRGELGEASRWIARSITADPYGAVSDLTQRVLNLVSRSLGNARSDGPCLDQTTARRLNRLRLHQ
jgi:glycosyltransferase involved in cell wall biosynthesis